MVRKNYLEDILAGSNALFLENEFISSIVYFVEACEHFFEIDVSKYTLQEEKLVIIQHLLEKWFTIKQVFLDERQFDSGEAIKHYYNCYQFHPYFDCFDLLTHEISSLLSRLKIKNGRINIGNDVAIINKLIAFHQQYKADFLKKVMAYKRMDEDRYKKVISYYEQFKQLPFSAGRDRKIYYFSIGLEIPKGFYGHSFIMQYSRCINTLISSL